MSLVVRSWNSVAKDAKETGPISSIRVATHYEGSHAVIHLTYNVGDARFPVVGRLNVIAAPDLIEHLEDCFDRKLSWRAKSTVNFFLAVRQNGRLPHRNHPILLSYDEDTTSSA